MLFRSTLDPAPGVATDFRMTDADCELAEEGVVGLNVPHDAVDAGRVRKGNRMLLRVAQHDRWWRQQTNVVRTDRAKNVCKRLGWPQAGSLCRPWRGPGSAMDNQAGRFELFDGRKNRRIAIIGRRVATNAGVVVVIAAVEDVLAATTVRPKQVGQEHALGQIKPGAFNWRQVQILFET